MAQILSLIIILETLLINNERAFSSRLVHILNFLGMLIFSRKIYCARTHRNLVL
jgi:hypothetical protein